MVANKNAEIRVDRRIITRININASRSDILIYYKKRLVITFTEIGITTPDRLLTIETKNKLQYHMFANKIRSENKCKTRIILNMLT